MSHYTISDVRDMINEIAENDATWIDMVVVSEMLEEYLFLKLQVERNK